MHVGLPLQLVTLAGFLPPCFNVHIGVFYKKKGDVSTPQKSLRSLEVVFDFEKNGSMHQSIKFNQIGRWNKL